MDTWMHFGSSYECVENIAVCTDSYIYIYIILHYIILYYILFILYYILREVGNNILHGGLGGQSQDFA